MTSTSIQQRLNGKDLSVDRMNPEELALREQRELQRTNALARHIAAVRTQMLEMGRLQSDELQRLQERHTAHLNRCLRLRSRLDVLARAEAPAPARFATSRAAHHPRIIP